MFELFKLLIDAVAFILFLIIGTRWYFPNSATDNSWTKDTKVHGNGQPY